MRPGNANIDAQAAPWRATAAYLYVLRLDPPALAWEYLRRDPAYRAGWRRRARLGLADPRPWGLRQLEDPDRDARRAHPVWEDDLASLLHLRTAGRDDGMAEAGLDLWHMPGEKHLIALPAGFALQARSNTQVLRARLAPGVLDGRPVVCTLPLDARLPARAALLVAQAAHLAPHRASAIGRHAATLRVPLAALHHLHALQALDGVRAGASQRAIAEVLYGPDRVRAQWHTDSALRAQLRHSLARGLALMRGGYRELAGLRLASSRT